MPRISGLDAETAIASAEQRETTIRDADALLNKDLMYFIDNFVLPEDPAECPQEFGRQLEAQHAAYLQQVREEIRLQSHNLQNFHARPRPCLSGEDHLGLGNLEDLDAMSKVVTLIATAVRHNEQMRSHYAEFVHIHDWLENINALAPLDRIFIKHTLPGIKLTMEASNNDVKKLKDKLQTFKQAFYLLANQTEVAACVTRLLGTRITAEEFAELAKKPFQELFRLARKRNKVIKKAGDIAISQALAWLSLPHGRVPSHVSCGELERYEPLLHSIESQKHVHDRCVGTLTMLHQQANGWPQAVVGPNDSHISLTVIRCAMQEYEWVTETSYQLIEAALPINDTLKCYIVELQSFFN